MGSDRLNKPTARTWTASKKGRLNYLKNYRIYLIVTQVFPFHDFRYLNSTLALHSNNGKTDHFKTNILNSAMFSVTLATYNFTSRSIDRR